MIVPLVLDVGPNRHIGLHALVPIRRIQVVDSRIDVHTEYVLQYIIVSQRIVFGSETVSIGNNRMDRIRVDHRVDRMVRLGRVDLVACDHIPVFGVVAQIPPECNHSNLIVLIQIPQIDVSGVSPILFHLELIDFCGKCHRNQILLRFLQQSSSCFQTQHGHVIPAGLLEELLCIQHALVIAIFHLEGSFELIQLKEMPPIDPSILILLPEQLILEREPPAHGHEVGQQGFLIPVEFQIRVMLSEANIEEEPVYVRILPLVPDRIPGVGFLLRRPQRGFHHKLRQMLVRNPRIAVVLVVAKQDRLIRSPVLRLRVRHDLQCITVSLGKCFHVNFLRLHGIQNDDFCMVVRSDPTILQEFLNVQNLNAKDHSIEMCLHI